MKAACDGKTPLVARTGGGGYGDGDWCPVEGHGRKYVLDGGTQWCPHQSHDDERIVRPGVASSAEEGTVGQVDGPAEGLAPLPSSTLPDLGDLNLA